MADSMKKILVVDDETDLLRVTAIRLQKKGYEVFEAVDGQEALNLACQKMPDLIILDVHLPVMNGDEVVKIFKKDENLKHIPIILTSLTDAVSLEKRFKECGADGYFAKSIETEALFGMIKKYISDATFD